MVLVEAGHDISLYLIDFQDGLVGGVRMRGISQATLQGQRRRSFTNRSCHRHSSPPDPHGPDGNSPGVLHQGFSGGPTSTRVQEAGILARMGMRWPGYLCRCGPRTRRISLHSMPPAYPPDSSIEPVRNSCPLHVCAQGTLTELRKASATNVPDAAHRHAGGCGDLLIGRRRIGEQEPE